MSRAFLRVISERQYARHPPDGSFSLGIPLKKALEQWVFLVKEGPPRSIDLSLPKFSEVVFFTDGFSPDPRFSEKKPDRIGAVMIDRRLTCPVQFTAVVPQKVKAQWLDRKTQIVPVEMLAPIIALSTFESRLVGCDVLLFVDSEAVEAALVKGYSSKSDLCDLIKSKSFGTWCLNYVSGCLSIVSQRMLTLRTGLPVMILKPVLKQVGSLFDRFGLMRYAEIPRGRAWVTISMMMMCWFCFSQSV